ncbi:MAG: HNH endonuclease [Flavobacteriaceae bacterium]|nr:HNH endonuclease [Flavobacteriaceae bacterium]
MIKDYRKERWKPFLLGEADYDTEDVQVSNYGRVKRKRKDETFDLVKFTKTGKFNMFWYLRKDGKKRTYYVHRAVANLFLDNQEDKRFVIHEDHDLENNYYKNLKWVNQKELTQHQMSNPIRQEKRVTHSKLTEGKVRLLKRKINDPNRRTRLKMIAKQFGISEMQLYRIKSGENWGNVTEY